MGSTVQQLLDDFVVIHSIFHLDLLIYFRIETQLGASLMESGGMNPLRVSLRY
jgi:hypothetical protein